jgi:hypothetical protein
MLAKMVLPLLGGAPSVWSTCVVFFQVSLVVGYAYAHFLTRWLGMRPQSIAHLILLSAALVYLPLHIPAGWMPPTDANPVGWLLLLLVVAVGLPFVIVSATSPLVQRWFAHSAGHHPDHDPYFLYSASNAGSVLALISYPFLVEPSLKTADQSRLWAMGYGVLVGLIGACALTAWPARLGDAEASDYARPAARSIKWATRLRWIALSMVPASYLLGVTTYITTDIAAVPLLWVLPLTLYLLSFILVFSRRPIVSHGSVVILLPIAVLIVVLLMIAQLSQPLWLILGVHLLAFFIAAMMCHGELVRLRPPPADLTEFYLMMSIGGALGGMFNALLAPVLFRSAAEYPLAIVAACLLLPSRAPQASRHAVGRAIALDAAVPIASGLTTAAWLLKFRSANAATAPAILALSLPLLICFAVRRRPVRFGLGLGAAVLASTFAFGPGDKVLLQRRSFFGVHRVVRDPAGPFNELFHGTTLHGRQFIDSTSLKPIRSEEPLTYYHRAGPAGSIMEIASAHSPQHFSVGAVGLGTGSMAAYARPGERWSFYEIDPTVLWLARDSGAFSYVPAAISRGADVQFILGDARLTLQHAPDHGFGLLILDAFSSDSIPVHLLTQEALEIYLRKLRPEGWIAIHISNQYLDLRPVLANLADHFGLWCVAAIDIDARNQEHFPGKEGSVWMLLGPKTFDVASRDGDSRWTHVDPQPEYGMWSDDFSNIVTLLQWNPTRRR